MFLAPYEEVTGNRAPEHPRGRAKDMETQAKMSAFLYRGSVIADDSNISKKIRRRPNESVVKGACFDDWMAARSVAENLKCSN